MKKNYFLFLVVVLSSFVLKAQDFTASSKSQANTIHRDIQDVIWNQAISGTTDGVVSDYFNLMPAGIYSADDFQLTQAAKIETITAYGFQNNLTLGALLTGIDVYIYSDATGTPSSNPNATGTGVLEIINLPAASPALTVTPDGLGSYTFVLDITVANGSEVILPTGIYWLVVAPRMDLSNTNSDNRWNWYSGDPNGSLSEAMLIDPDGAFGGFPWTKITDIGTTFTSLAFTIEGTYNLGIIDSPLSQISVYPNPSSDIIKIKAKANISIEKVIIYNLLGKEIGVKLDNNNLVDISDLASGIYIIKIHSSEGEITKRIIKQ